MKKEKQVKSYSRKTKSGKMVTVKAHTAKYDSAEDIAKEILKKKGAGSELEARMKNKGKQLELPFDKEEEVEKEEKKVPEKEKTTKVEKGKSTKTKVAKQPADKQSLSQADFKAWYHWDMDSDPNNESAKRAEKCLKKKLGAKKYKELLNKETENYSSRGHVKSFKALSEAMEDNTAVRGAKKVKGAATAQKEMAKQMGATDAVKKFDKKIAEAKNTIKSKDTKYGRSKLDSDIVKSAATKHKLAYDEDGHYVDKNGQTYDISPKGKVTKRKYKYDSPDAYSHPDKDKKVSVAKNTSKSKSSGEKNSSPKNIDAELKKMGLRMHRTSTGGIEIYRVGDRKSLNNLVAGVHYNGDYVSFGGKNEKENKAKYSSALSELFTKKISKASGGKKDPNADFMSAIKADISAPVKAKGKFALGDATLRKQKLRKVLKEMRSGSLDKKEAIKILGYDPSKK